MNLTRFIDDIPSRLIYSLYIPNNINSINEDRTLSLHFICLEYVCGVNGIVFDEVKFIICTDNTNKDFIDDVKIRLSNIFINTASISFIKEYDDSFRREGRIFDEYIIKHLEEYDGITLFFHNKRLRPSFFPNTEDITYWIIGQYWFCMNNTKYMLESFITNNTLIYGWPFMHDNHHPKYLIGGNCFWMKCQEIFNYINSSNQDSLYITKRCAGEYWTITNLPLEAFDYPDSDKIKNYVNVQYYEPAYNDLFVEYLKNTMIYNTFNQFNDFFNKIMAIYNESIL